MDISSQESKTQERYLGEPFDYVVTVCDEANEACPFFCGAAKCVHWSLPDPAVAAGTEEERLEVFRSVRERLRYRIEGELLNE
jgi:arsenate reductase (thioredoxin)